MKSASAGLAAHLAGESLTLATLWRIVRRDGQVFTFTDHNRDIVYGGETYLAAIGYQRSAITSNSDLAVDETELLGLLDSASISEDELRAGLWDGASVRIFVVNWADLTQGELKLRRGTIGEVITRDDGSFRAELRGLAQPLQTVIGSVYQAECRADLGDSRCKVPLRPSLRANSTSYALGAVVRVLTLSPAVGNIYDEEGVHYVCTTAGVSAGAPPTFDPTVDATTTDGSVVWTARPAWTQPATIETVADADVYVLVADGIEAFASASFSGGVVVWETGTNAGVAREILDWAPASGRRLTLFSPPPFTPSAGDVLRLQYACDKRWSYCRDTFANQLNFRGEPLVPGANAILAQGGQ